jgi:hypothetical protein
MEEPEVQEESRHYKVLTEISLHKGGVTRGIYQSTLFLRVCFSLKLKQRPLSLCSSGFYMDMSYREINVRRSKKGIEKSHKYKI